MRAPAAIAAIGALILGGCGGGGATTAPSPQASGIAPPQAGESWADLAAKVPAPAERGEVARVLRTIASGDSLPYEQDGGVFGNREGHLPDLPAGLLYREYTVPTPGSSDRGARRLIVGDDGSVYYTSDHYSSFTRLDE